MTDETRVVPADIVVDTDLVRQLISRDFPNISTKKIRILGEGWDNLVFLIDEKWVFRFPRRAVAVPLLERELAVLTAVADQLPVSVPEPQFVGNPSKEFPWPYYGHAQIEGSTGCKMDFSAQQYRNIAGKLATALKTLHSLDPGILASPVGRPIFDRTNFSQMLQTFKERQGPIRIRFGTKGFDNLFAEISEKAACYQTEKSSIIHGDLYNRHLIFNSDRNLAGIIDWGDSGVSDPVIDMLIVYQFLPPKIHPYFFDIYGHISEESSNYAKFLALYSAAALFWYGESRQDSNLTTTSLKTVEYLHFQD